MAKLQFKTTINAPAEKVWDIMLQDETYREWTEEFNPGSYYEGGWEMGDKIRFVGPDENGNEGGIVGKITQSRKPEYVEITYTGVIVNGVEDTTSPEIQVWIGAKEAYTFEEENGVTNLTVDLEIEDSEKDMFEEMWPRALVKLKEICER